ncbi:MAG: DUF4115 domain-containing protein [Deltaproteobacteria bacterium]|nr:DUF4115 domain-containing protein [Deltaproteobacteria bacterium]
MDKGRDRRERAYRGFIAQGRPHKLEGRRGFFLTIGNAGAVELKLNGQSVGPVGKVGEVARITLPSPAANQPSTTAGTPSPAEDKSIAR